MDFFRKNVLLLTVFVTGALVLVLEITANRILSPYFGSTLYTISSVISVILASLSFGYYFGGRYADKNPSKSAFFNIIILSAVFTLILQLLNVAVLPFLGYSLPIDYGPLAVSILLFVAPSFLLGTLSPFAIKLQEVEFPEKGIGKISGEVFFASTFGSIFGSLLSGFYLIPAFGINQIIIGTAVILFVLGVLGRLFLSKKKLSNPIIVIFLTLFVSNYYFLHSYRMDPRIVYAKDGYYSRIQIFDAQYNDQDARILALDRSTSSGIKKETGGLVFDYTKYYSLYEMTDSNVENALVLGAGAYTIPKTLLESLPDAQVDAVEIEPWLYPLSKKYFGIYDSPRLASYIKDGRRFLVENDKKYDYIFSDVYSSVSVPAHFTTQEFFELLKQNAKENAVIIINVIGDIPTKKPSYLFSEIKTFRKVFPNSHFIAVKSPKVEVLQNVIFLAINNKTKYDLEKISKENLDDPLLGTLSAKSIDLEKYDLSKEILITDNFAPTEKLLAEMFVRHKSD